MHPSRVVALCFLGVSLLLVAQLGLVSPFTLTLPTVVQLLGAAMLVLGSLYGLVRYEENPIVTEYGPEAYLLIGASLFLFVALALSIALSIGV
ncbi:MULTISPECIES: hypothetical protein [Halomicrobium]|uniref:Uncharacterized protein n=2 Tax=Halomicrobium mukohataei TaxID=57705 RepID=C7P190_HALMD|nr:MULTISPECIES: hypothetical protein [Halomicrobium]ACV47098.1 hypothetical protein Hmuk_0969 [Halomicrobium mukohataei DSM 12286]QCD65583.1 hypothetical protein E5139_08010 [Halomicrobium mukohataei]QFR20389.1 hypothetical protein GBQ70_08005 [Halomicrobium sp. ZPS1]